MEQTVVYKPHMTKKKAVLGTIKWLFLGVMIIFTLYPIIYTILGSLKTNAELTMGGNFFPSEWHFDNYYKAFVEADFLTYTKNSIFVSFSVTILSLIHI